MNEVSNFVNKSSHSHVIQKKKAALVLTMLNPFYDTHEVKIQTRKSDYKETITIDTSAIFQAKDGYFRKKPIFEFINDIILGKRVKTTKETQLGIIAYNAA